MKLKSRGNQGKGIAGICIHNLKDKDGNQSNKGKIRLMISH